MVVSFYRRFLTVRNIRTAPTMIITITTKAIPSKKLLDDTKPEIGVAVGSGVGAGT